MAQIAAVLPGVDMDDGTPHSRDIVLYCQDNPNIPKRNTAGYHPMTRIDERHRAYDGLQYPLMLPDGSYGWAPRAYPFHKLSARQKKLQTQRQNAETLRSTHGNPESAENPDVVVEPRPPPPCQVC